MGLSVIEIAASIAALEIPGLTIRDLDDMPQGVTATTCPILYPDPDGFMSGLSITVDSFGSSSAKKTIYYTLSYVLIYAPVGLERGLYKIYKPFVTLVLALLDEMINNDALSGAIDFTPQDMPVLGVLKTPTDESFYGARFAFRVMEFSEV